MPSQEVVRGCVIPGVCMLNSTTIQNKYFNRSFGDGIETKIIDPG